MNCHVTTTSSLPRSHVHALRDPDWKEAMLDEYNALITNGTWILVPRPTNVNVVRSMWIFKHKFNADGSLSSGLCMGLSKPRVLGFSALLVMLFQHSKTDSSLFVFHRGSNIAYLLLYVDDIILTSSSSVFLQRIIASLFSEFAMKDLGSLNYFLGIFAQLSASDLFLSQSKFVEEILERDHMQNCNPCRTPVDTEAKLGSNGDRVNDPTLYRSLAGALQYLIFTCPDLSYAANSAYTDVDWAGCLVTRRSTSGYCVFLGDNLLSWSAERQVTLSRSSTEAEYRGVANVCCLIVCKSGFNFSCTKHIEIDIHFVRDFVASGQVRVLHVPSRFQYADIFTKGLPTALFIEFRSSLNVRRSPAHTEGE
ncbi:ribonuclease H-like domain-containing protein [Tanacetum coccineum]